jgi:hypothetical protein
MPQVALELELDIQPMDIQEMAEEHEEEAEQEEEADEQPYEEEEEYEETLTLKATDVYALQDILEDMRF